MVDVLQELVRRGHDVLVASAPSLGALCARYGLNFAAVGPDFRVGEESRLIPELARARRDNDRDFAYTRIVLVQTLAHATLPDLIRLAQRWRPDVVVRDPVEFAGLAVAEAAGLPHVTGRDNRFLPPSTWRTELGDSLDSLGRAAGAAALDIDALDRYLTLAPALPSFVTATSDLPDPREFNRHIGPTHRFLRPRTPTRGGNASRTPHVARGAVLLTSGTVYVDDADIRGTVRAVATDLGRMVIDSDQDRDSGGESWLDFDAIVPRCAVVVTVGGFGTVMAALRYGVPVVVLPSGADHETNGRRCAALGVGAHLPRATLTPATLRAAIDRVINDPAYASAAAESAKEWRGLPDRDWGAELIEAVAGKEVCR
jgi:N-glycosyltransferase